MKYRLPAVSSHDPLLTRVMSVRVGAILLEKV